jgi:thymidine kinase
MSLELIIGPMFACKTSYMFIKFDKYTYNKKGMLFMWKSDTRYSEKSKIVTHSKTERNAVKIEYAEDLLKYIDKVDVFGIDEIQFIKGKKGEKEEDMSKNVFNIINYLIKKDKMIVCSGLLADYRRKVWPVVSELIGISDNIITLKALCKKCGGSATCTYLKGHGKNSSANIIITSTYSDFIPLCTKCYNEMYE